MKNQITDAQIIDLYWARNEDALHQTHIKYGEYLFRIAYSILGSKPDSEECQNDTYLRAWNAMPPTRPRVLPAFLSKITRNTAINRYKALTRQKRVRSELTMAFEELSNILSTGETPEGNLEAAELGQAINGYLGTLNRRQRYLFIGRYYMGETLEALASRLQCNASTVHRELRKLQQDLKIYLERMDIYV